MLPPGVYRFANAPHESRLAALAFALGSYRFARYRKAERPMSGWCRRTASTPPISRGWRGGALARDLINTPSNDMGPEELAQPRATLAERFGASFSCIVGDELLDRTFR